MSTYSNNKKIIALPYGPLIIPSNGNIDIFQIPVKTEYHIKGILFDAINIAQLNLRLKKPDNTYEFLSEVGTNPFNTPSNSSLFRKISHSATGNFGALGLFIENTGINKGFMFNSDFLLGPQYGLNLQCVGTGGTVNYALIGVGYQQIL